MVRAPEAVDVAAGQAHAPQAAERSEAGQGVAGRGEQCHAAISPRRGFRAVPSRGAGRSLRRMADAAPRLTLLSTPETPKPTVADNYRLRSSADISRRPSTTRRIVATSP